MKKMFYKVGLLLIGFASTTYAQINNPLGAVVPFGSNPGYGTNGMVPSSSVLPGVNTQYGKSTEAATAYTTWKSEFREVCSGKGARIRFDNASETVSEGIAYGMLLAAYAADKTFFDELYTFWKANLSNNGLMNWKINGCNQATGTGSATDADFDAAYALLVAANQWPAGNYKTEFDGMIGKIKQFDMASNGRATNGDSWFQSDCTNPGYHSPGYYQAFAAANTANASFWSNTAYNFTYDVLWANNANGTTGLVSNWSTSSGSANQCNSAGNGQTEAVGFGYDASRFPWRVAQDVLWYNSTKGRALANKMTTYLKGRGVNNIGGPLNLNGTNGSGYQQNATFISMLALATMAADNNATNQAFLDNMYTKTVNSISGDNYFGKTLRVLSLFMLTGNFWKIGTVSNEEINVRATGVKVGTGSVLATNVPVLTGTTYDFQNTQITGGNPDGKTVTFTLENLGAKTLNLTGNPKVVVSGTDAGLFTVVQPTPSSLTSSAPSTTFTVQFKPTTTGVKTATLTIASNDADEASYVINITGTGTQNAANSNLVVTQYDKTPVTCGGTLNFGDVTGVTSTFASRVLKIKNTGDGALVLSTLSYSSTRFSTVGTAPTTVAVGDSALLTVQFNPTATGVVTGTLTIPSNDPVKPSCVINLSGNGVACGSTGNILQDFDGNNNLVQKTGNVNATFTFNNPNPFITPQNPSGNVGKLVIPAAAGAYSKAIVFTPCAGAGNLINYTGRKTLTMLIYSEKAGTPISVALKNAAGFTNVAGPDGCSSYCSIAAGNFATTKVNQWEKIVMDFGTQSGAVWNPLTDAEANTSSYIEININNSAANGATALTYYIDDLKFEDNPCIAGIPATKVLNDFDANQYLGLAYTNATSNLAVTPNPSATGINVSNSVAKHDRVLGTGVAATDEYDNGLRFSGCNGKVDMSINNGILSVMIYSPVAGVPIQANIMKADGADADSNPDEVGSVVTVAALPNTWQKVYFDFSAYKANTSVIAIDLFIDAKRTKGVQTYYFDNLMYDVLPNCTADIAATGVLMDFDKNRNITKLYPGAPEFDDVAANPSTVGNPSALAGKLVRAATGQFASSIRFSSCGSNFKLESGKNKLELLVYSPQVGTEVAIDLKTAAEVSVKQVIKATTKAAAWEKLVFDFSDVTNNTTAALLDIFIDPTAKFVATEAARTYYIDSLKYGKVDGPEIAVFNGTDLMPTASTQSFGSVLVGTSSDTLNYSIKNFGSSLLTLTAAPSDLVITGPGAGDFKIIKNPTYVTNISANSATNFFIYFRPSSGGVKTATLTIANNDSDEAPYVINLTATATCPAIDAPTVAAPQLAYCAGTTAPALTATASGSNVLYWYTLPTNGTSSTTAPVPSTTTAGLTTYYVSQGLNGCESARKPIAVTVEAKPTVTVSADQPQVEGPTASVTVTITNATSGTWSQVGGPVTTGITYTPNAAATAVTIGGLTQIGTYTFKYTVAAGTVCTEVSDEVTLIVTQVTSSTDQLLGTEVSIYPNPASDKINITASGLNDVNITVTDVYGKVVFSGNQNTAEVSMTEKAAGMYIVQVKSGNSVLTKTVFKK